jgi:primosomal protein N' (replication factor Y)
MADGTEGDVAQVAVFGGTFSDALSYAIPSSLRGDVVPGTRVRVPLGTRQVIGIVVARGEKSETRENRNLRLIEDVVDEKPLLLPQQIDLCRFVSQYYLAPLGDTLRLCLPPGSAKEAPADYHLTEKGLQARVFGKAHGLSREEEKALALFSPDQKMSRAEIKRGGVRPKVLNGLTRGGFLECVARSAGAKRRTITQVRARDGGQSLPARSPALAELDAYLRELNQWIALPQLSTLFPNARGKVKRLVELARAEVDEVPAEVNFIPVLAASRDAISLTEHQVVAVEKIQAAFEAPHAFLLQGVTGSGKTEVYLRGVQKALSLNKTALVVVPEIALTPQLLARVHDAVGEKVAVLHSALSPAERRDTLFDLLEGRRRVLVGARSALFAPMPNLGLIVIDEEHDGSLKQDDAPRYHARDLALWRGQHEGAVVVLGSATPSLESQHNVELGKVELLPLPERVSGSRTLPEVEVIDLRMRRAHGPTHKRDRALSEGATSVVVSGPLQDALTETLENNEQALLFLNRRGYAACTLCDHCGHILQCPQCTVNLTFHRRRNRLICHHCDHTQGMPPQCPNCVEGEILTVGLGTERVENELAQLFPSARIARLDRDVIKNHRDLENILRRVQRREVDLVVGTQMIAKGHDFPGVALVGVVLADIALGMPDFRATERAFQLLTQVAGRAGRGDKVGRVLVQTFNPDHPALVYAQKHDVIGFSEEELALRKAARFPPYCRAALLRIDGKDEGAVVVLARLVADRLKALAEKEAPKERAQILGPAPAPFEKLRGKTRHQVFVQAQSHSARRRMVQAILDDGELSAQMRRQKCALRVDIDPVNLM